MSDPTNINQLKFQMEDRLRINALRTLAVLHLSEAIAAIQHHVKPTGKLAAKMKELHPEWHCWVNPGNEEKFEPWRLNVSGNGLPNGEGIEISIQYVPTWDELWKEVRRHDFSKSDAEIKLSLSVMDTLEALEDEAIAALAAVQEKVPFRGSHWYLVNYAFPLLFKDAGRNLSRGGAVIANNEQIKRMGGDPSVDQKSIDIPGHGTWERTREWGGDWRKVE